MQVRMRAGFLDLAQEFSDRFRIIDGDRKADVVADEIAALVRKALV
jgi:dTMP kinase